MKGIFFLIVIALLVSLIGFATNPTYEDFKDWYKSQNYEDRNVSTKIEKSVIGLVSDYVADKTVIRDDHKIYSLYTMEGEYNYKVLGVFNNFFVLDNNEVIATIVN